MWEALSFFATPLNTLSIHDDVYEHILLLLCHNFFGFDESTIPRLPLIYWILIPGSSHPARWNGRHASLTESDKVSSFSSAELSCKVVEVCRIELSRCFDDVLTIYPAQHSGYTKAKTSTFNSAHIPCQRTVRRQG